MGKQIMEDVIPLLQSLHRGAGLMGKQGAEDIHVYINKLERSYWGIPNDVM